MRIRFHDAGLVLALAMSGAGLGANAQTRQIDNTEFDALRGADVVILGEVHDNPDHHAFQAAAVAALSPKAIVFEMLTDAQALRIRPEHLENADILGAVLGWQNSGWPDFEMYYPIFTAAEGALIFGGALEQGLARRAVSDGAAQVFGPAAGVFGLQNPLDDAEQSQREAGQMAAHCDALPISMLQGMVEAQRLRDAGMARAVLAAMAETGGPVVVITGNGHARRDWGVARDLDLALPDIPVISLAQLETAPDGDLPFDLWRKTPTIERPDPCRDFSIHD